MRKCREKSAASSHPERRKRGSETMSDPRDLLEPLTRFSPPGERYFSLLPLRDRAMPATASSPGSAGPASPETRCSRSTPTSSSRARESA